MAIINVPNKSAGDTFFSEEANEIVNAIKALQTSTGWGVYRDDQFTQGSPQTVTGTAWQQIANNAASKNEDYLPGGDTPHSLYNGNIITPPSVGSTFNEYLSFVASINSQNSSFDIGIDIGGAVGVIFVNTNTLPRGANVEHEFTIPVNGYMLDTFFTNGGKIMIRTESGDTVSLYGAVFYISIDSQPI